MINFFLKIIGNLEDNNDTGAVFLDLANAFNSISHEIFLKKTENFNLSINSFTFQIFSRKSNTMRKTGFDLSDKITINYSVQQGTVLGPLIFPLYVNDFSEKLEGKKDVQFADDTSIICKFESNENILQKIEKILEHADKYLTKINSL